MPAKKIIIISTVDYFGGTRTYLENLLSFYGKKKVELILAANKSAFNKNIQALLDKYKFEHLMLPENYGLFYKLLATLPLLKTTYDLFVINNVVKRYKPDLTVITPFEPSHYFSSILLNIKKILVVHSYPNSKLKPIFRFIANLASNNYILLTVSKSSLEAIKQYWPNSITKHSSYIYNPSNRVKLTKAKKNTILTMGHLEWYKDPYTWLNVAEETLKLSKKELCFEWRGDGSLKPSIISEINRRGLSNKVFIKPPTDDLSDLYSRCLIYFQPSLVESQGISVSTAQSLGIPCVVSNVGGLPEMIMNGISGYIVQSKDVKKMTKAIVSIITNGKTYNRLSKNVINTLSIDTSIANWEEKMIKIHQDLKIWL